MKPCVIFYHKNILELYEREWIDKCIKSIQNQSLQLFDVLELNYGDIGGQFCTGIRHKSSYRFYHIPMSNHIEAMNYIIDTAFGLKYDIVFNTNMDDYYEPERFKLQLQKIEEGYQIVSSNFRYFGDRELDLNMTTAGDIGENLGRGHNIIAHPCIAMHKSFWEPGLHYNNLLGYEDLDLWQRAYNAGKKFFILEDYLLNYRIHTKQVTKSYPGK